MPKSELIKEASLIIRDNKTNTDITQSLFSDHVINVDDSNVFYDKSGEYSAPLLTNKDGELKPLVDKEGKPVDLT